MADDVEDVSSSDAQHTSVVLMTGGLQALKEVGVFLQGHGITATIVRPEDCSINS